MARGSFKSRFIVAALVTLSACTDTGQVDQGKVVAFDAQQRIVTIVRDGDQTAGPVRYALPDDPKEIGPLPQHGDVVRIYYTEAGKARRLMNVTRTNIYKK